MEKYFKFLDGLRESGKANILGAGAYLQSAYGLGREEARDVLNKWMSTFDPDKTPAERAKEAS